MLTPRTAARQASLGVVGTGALIAALAFVFSAFGVGGPSAWLDEAATASMVDRPIGDLIQTVSGHVDAVHGLYYLLLKSWTAAFGSSIVALRVPSALGAAAGAVVVWLTARKIWRGPGALVAPVVFVAIPMITRAAIDARSASWAATTAAILTLLLLRGLETGRSRWIAYAAVAVLGTYLFLYTVLVVLAHLIAVLASSGTRHRLKGLLAADAVAALLVTPLLLAASRQQQQVSWISGITLRTIGQVGLQWFPDSVFFAVPALLLVAVGCLTLLAKVRARGESQTAAVVLIAWLIVPTVLLLLATALGKPLYVNRYSVVSVPAVALVLTAAVQRLERRGAMIAVVVLLVVLSVPTYLQQRSLLGKGTDWSAAAADVRSMREPLTGIYFPVSPDAPRMMIYAYPAAFAGLRDVALLHPAPATDSLWDEVRSLRSATDRTTGLSRMLIVGAEGTRSDEAVAAFKTKGFRVRAVSDGPFTTIIEMVK